MFYSISLFNNIMLWQYIAIFRERWEVLAHQITRLTSCFQSIYFSLAVPVNQPGESDDEIQKQNKDSGEE
ncbi:MAG: hypothetical protein R3B53_02540 [Candidatus Paceibacterota bacterium]